MSKTASSDYPLGMESQRAPGVPRGVVILGVVSLLTDLSSEMIFAVLPIFVTRVLGAPMVVLGAMEGAADFAASSLDLASGYLADRTGARKRLAFAGYALSSAAKGFLVLASGAGQVFAFRVVERLGKSIRGAPRDALLASIAPAASRGTSFGVHKALDKAGAILGPLAAFAILERGGASAATFRTLFAVALAPALLSLAVLGLFVAERDPAAPRPHPGLRAALATLGPAYRHYLATAAIFSVAYSSFAFLLLAADRVGFAAADVALLYALFNGVFTLVSIPLGRVGDRIGRRRLIALSYAAYAAMAAGFALAASKAAVLGLFALYGVFFAIDEGQTKAYLADLSPPETRATAIGIYGLVTGLVYLPASLVAGGLWSLGGPAATFSFATAVSLAALAFFVFRRPR
jgi:MFS family permease